MFRFLITGLALSLSASALAAHEFWIEPLKWQIPKGATIEAHIRVGENLKGGALSYFPDQVRRFDVATPNGIYKASTRIGDRPVLRGAANDVGLYVVVYATQDFDLDYDVPGKFLSFLESKGIADAMAAHEERGLPEVGFTEQYSRYAKSLVAVGHGRGQDREFGMETEITALANPYTDDLSGGLPIYLSYQGAPRAGAQIEIFQRTPDGVVTIELVQSDAEGKATVPVRPGHDYMLDSVVIRPLEPAEDGDPVWETLWANLTFSVPPEGSEN